MELGCGRDVVARWWGLEGVEGGLGGRLLGFLDDVEWVIEVEWSALRERDGSGGVGGCGGSDVSI